MLRASVWPAWILIVCAGACSGGDGGQDQPQPVDDELVDAIVANTFAGDVRGDGNYNYRLTIDRTSDPYRLTGTINQNTLSCPIDAGLSTEEMEELDELVRAMAYATRTNTGTEFCLDQFVELVWRQQADRDPITASTINNGCGSATYILCQPRDELYRFLDRVVTAAAPDGCPADLVRRDPLPETSYPPPECAAVE